jgi:transposase-like protein
MAKQTRFSLQIRERAVRLVQEHRSDYETQWVATTSMASTIGWAAETLGQWVRRAERDTGQPPGLTTDEQGAAQGARTREPRAAPCE